MFRLKSFLSALLVFEETLWQLQDSERQIDELLQRNAELEARLTELLHPERAGW